MNNRQLAVLQAARRSHVILRKHREAWNANPGFVRQQRLLSSTIEKTGALLQEQEDNSKGITVAKQEQREQVISQTLEIAGMVNVWAMEQGDRELEERTAVTRTSLRETRAKLPEHATRIHDLAAETLGKGIEDFGLTREKLDRFSEKIARLADINQGPKTAQTEGKTVTRLLAEKITELSAILGDRIDRLMWQFEEADPKFFQDYYHARRVGDTTRRRRGEKPGEDETPNDTEEAEAKGESEAEQIAILAELQAIREELVAERTATAGLLQASSPPILRPSPSGNGAELHR